ncbi:IclR family transcriptional regulator [Pseudomonas sp. P1.8]|jgi:DNA-binding IclR family transcriptional regulator|uniref:IclR family transcriptional regulator n=1 Tax=Pseudomonas sp. P1.8 TaxID=1699310 RepID=UPI00069D4782|nr:IclR family transcriptional regulator [Pseudomonas sp. P1.8]
MSEELVAKTTDSETKAYAAPALEKGLDILEMLCATEQPLTQREIAQRLGRSVGEVYRMINCLVGRNYVSLLDDSYSITTKLFELAHMNPPTQRLLNEARPIMHKLSNDLEQSCHLTLYGQGKQMVIAKVDVPSGMGFSVRVGAELDVIVSASGRVLLAFQDKGVREIRIEESLARTPEYQDPQLDMVLERIRSDGFESAHSIQVRGLHAISFPILDVNNHAIAALTVPYSERIDQRGRKSISDAQISLGNAAKLLSSRVGGKQ